MKIFLIRHGESESDIEDKYGGDYDDHLTDRGKEQANKLALKLTKSGIQFIFSSPRFRTMETSKIISNSLNCEMKIVDNLRERNFYGILTGMKKSEAKEKFPELVEKLIHFNNTIDGAEDYELFKKRITNSINEITSSNCDIIAIVTHGGPITYFVREILKLGEIKIGDCAYLEIEKKIGKFELINIEGAKIE